MHLALLKNFLHGIATGSDPRLRADAFRQGVESGVARTFALRGQAEFLNLDDFPINNAKSPRAAFDITVAAEYPPLPR